MTVCFALVEGQTELAFLNNAVKPHLARRGVTLTVGLSAKTGGGTPKWEATLRDIRGKLMERGVNVVTTMFDFYGLPLNWPGRQSARDRSLKSTAAVQHIEDALAHCVAGHMGQDFNGRRFIPYIQQYEFEGLLFSDPVALAQGISQPQLAKQFQDIREEFNTPEDINDSPHTAPSKRIMQIHPPYQKLLHGVLAAKAMGLETIRRECPRFNAWVSQLESLGTESARNDI